MCLTALTTLVGANLIDDRNMFLSFFDQRLSLVSFNLTHCVLVKKKEVVHFYDGCVVVEVRDYRTAVNHLGQERPPKYVCVVLCFFVGLCFVFFVFFWVFCLVGCLVCLLVLFADFSFGFRLFSGL